MRRIETEGKRQNRKNNGERTMTEIKNMPIELLLSVQGWMIMRKPGGKNDNEIKKNLGLH